MSQIKPKAKAKKEAMHPSVMEEAKKTHEIAKDQTKFQKWSEAKFQEVANFLLLDFIKITFVYPDKADFHNGGNMVYRVDPQPEYHRIRVSCYPPAYSIWQSGDLVELTDIIVHELAHIHTTPLSKLATNRFSTGDEIGKEVEHLTETIAEYIRINLRKSEKSPYKGLKK